MITNSFYIGMVANGYGHHKPVLSGEPLIMILKLSWLSQTFYKISLALTKCSLILLYMRIFHTIRWFKRLSYGMLGFLTLYAIISCFIGIFQCLSLIHI